MNNIKCFPIGTVQNENGSFALKINRPYREGLIGLEGFSHVQILCWMHACDNDDARSTVKEIQPYVKGPDEIGIFATRSPERPNPIGICVAEVTGIDLDAGEIGLTYVDLFDGTPILDVKPYTPSVDRVESPEVPAWCRHWPKSFETSGDFDWESEFNF